MAKRTNSVNAFIEAIYWERSQKMKAGLLTVALVAPMTQSALFRSP